ncbi:integrase, catalytic region, zinc finger, CCHC-type containing protein [Tanacetum coccineum]
MDAIVQQSSIDKQCLEIAKKELLLENDRLLQQIMSQDVLLTVMNSMSLIGEYVNMERKRNESYDKCFNLDVGLLKSQNAHNDLLKSYSQLEKLCISLKLSIQLNQEIFQKHEYCDNQNALKIPEFFKNNDLKAQVVQIVLWYLDSGCSKHMTGNRSQLMNFVSKFLGTVRFGNDHIARIMGSRDTNLYIISLDDMLKTSPICLLSKASKTKSWLWHRRLSHLNFGTLNKLAKDGLARGIPRLKFQKDHLCSACALGKSTKSSHQPKAEDTNQEKLYLFHMDLCGPMRVVSINEKSSGPGLHSLTPATPSSGLVSNLVSQQPCIPPKRDDWDRLFQPMFDEYFIPPSIAISPVQDVAPRVVILADSPVSTSIDQDAPSTSIPST